MSKSIDMKIGNVVITPKVAETLNDWLDEEYVEDTFPYQAVESIGSVQDRISRLLCVSYFEDKKTEAEQLIHALYALVNIKEELKKIIPERRCHEQN